VQIDLAVCRGKVSRLPLAIRRELNTRLHAGERGLALVDWLNSLPAVKEVLSAEFAGRPISPQNLSEYRNRAYAAWLRENLLNAPNALEQTGQSGQSGWNL
jgi:hypothetical protein